MKVLILIGTRPECIKLAPVYTALKLLEGCEAKICFTGQHKEMAQQVIDLFDLPISWHLELMTKDQTLASLSARCLSAVDRVCGEWAPDWLIVQGDTTTAMMGALAGFYRSIKVAHVEAGLRTGNMYHPWPEELNRRVIDLFATAYFPPTDLAANNLRNEGIPEERIMVSGNTGIDALLRVSQMNYSWCGSPIQFLEHEENIVLVTAHRRESFGKPIDDLCSALERLAILNPDTKIVFPVHLNPRVQAPVRARLHNVSNIYLLDPLDYASLVQCLKKSQLVLTDSGGIQEEAPSFGVPILVMRETTERPEAVHAGFAQIVGTDPAAIVAIAQRTLGRPRNETMIKAPNPYGDGMASERIASFLINYGL